MYNDIFDRSSAKQGIINWNVIAEKDIPIFSLPLI